MNQLSTTYVSEFNFVFYLVVGISIVLFLLILSLMIFFVIRYHKKRNPVASQIHGNNTLEVIWTIIPLILVLVMFYYGDVVYRQSRNIPENAITVKVLGRMWDWSFEYENGKRTTKLYVPVDVNVKLEITSADVVHSLYIPAFREKMDAVPGKVNYLWFKPQTIGSADIYCAEFCGDQHAYMMSKVIIMPREEFDQWYNQAEITEASLLGEKAELSDGMHILEVNGCLNCHDMNDKVKQGPPLNGIFGQERIVFTKTGKKTVKVDEDYLRRSILYPEEEIVQGFGNWMPPTKYLSEEELKKIIEVIKRSE